MAITMSCQCGKRLKAKNEDAGKRVKCPACGAGLVIPAPKGCFQCPSCGKRLSVTRECAGKQGKCPGCGTVITIPRTSSFTDPATRRASEKEALVSTSRRQTHCPSCGEPLRQVLKRGVPTGQQICVACNASPGICPVCRRTLRTNLAQQCPSCQSSWHRTVLDELSETDVQAAKTRAKTLDSISKYRDEFLAMVSLFGQILFKSCPPDLLRTGDMSQLLAVQAITDARLEFKIMHPEVSEKIIEEIIIAAGKRGFDHVTHGTEQLCPELSTEELLRRLGAKDPGTRRDAISALGKKGSQESVPHLVKMLNDEDEFVRVHAAMALGRLGDHSALPDLESARASVSNDVQFHFDEAISQIKGRNLPEDERTPRAEEARRRAERLQGKSKKRARPSADWRRYKSSLHGFEIQFPRSWRVADENKPSGDSTAWLVALGVVGPQYDEGCAAFMVSVLGRGAFGGKWNVQGRDVIPHTATDFIPIARAQNAAGFDHVRHESEDVVTIADSDAAQLVYSYVGGADRIREMSVFVFREDATYQLTFECPAKHFKKNQAAFERIAASFRPQEPSPVTPDQELAELRQQLGPGSNFMSFQEIARVDKEMGEMYIQCPKCRHCERINDTGKMMLKQGNNVFATYTCPGCSHVYDGAQHIRKGECPSS